MSGHSKWATTKNKKAAADAKKASAFTKLSKNITIAARAGGDPDMNFSLRLAIDRAKASSMPRENIERAIKRGTGELEGTVIEEVLYEGFGPSGVALVVEGVTDNRNRTTSDVKSILTSHGGTLGGPNSVKWMFDRKGVIHLLPEQVGDKDALTMEMLDNGADDVVEEDGGLTAYCKFEDFERLRKFLEAKGLALEYAAVEWVKKDAVDAATDVREKIDALVEELEDNDDVNAVYTNIKS